jgi:hypothetical protein
MKQQTETFTERCAEHKTVHLRFKKREGKRLIFRQSGKGGKIVIFMPVNPGVGDTVDNPFLVSGTFDFTGDLPQVSVTSDTGAGTFGPEAQVDPPQGMDWAFRFNVRGGDYTVNDLEGSTLYVVDPIHVQ